MLKPQKSSKKPQFFSVLSYFLIEDLLPHYITKHFYHNLEIRIKKQLGKGKINKEKKVDKVMRFIFSISA